MVMKWLSVMHTWSFIYIVNQEKATSSVIYRKKCCSKEFNKKTVQDKNLHFILKKFLLPLLFHFYFAKLFFGTAPLLGKNDIKIRKSTPSSLFSHFFFC